MPLATLHLLALSPDNKLRDLLQSIQSLPPSQQPVILSKPIRWIIHPELIDAKALLHPIKPWDLLYIHLGTEALPPSITTQISDRYTLQTGIPSRLLQDFAATNQALLHPPPASVPELTRALDNPDLTRSAQDLSLSHDLQQWISSFAQTNTGRSPVSMLNLLAFKPGQKGEYIRYGKEFAKSIGSKHGGNAKLVGHVVSSPPDSRGTVWEEFALAQYPSILHFADMLASRDYQAVNQEFRVPSLMDTCILCTSEIEIEDILGGGGFAKSRL